MGNQRNAGGEEFTVGGFRAGNFRTEGGGEGAADVGEIDADFFKHISAEKSGFAMAGQAFSGFFPGVAGKSLRGFERLEGS